MSDHGKVGSRGDTSCGWFHEFLPGPDGWCNCCRPAPNHPVIVRAEIWIMKIEGVVPIRATKDWRLALDRWDAAGRPLWI